MIIIHYLYLLFYYLSLMFIGVYIILNYKCNSFKTVITIKVSHFQYFSHNNEKKLFRRKKDIADLCSDTQSSSPGGWQSRLSSFLHVKGMSISGIGGGAGSSSRASSRKSSRASDASDISELGASLWLNLPLFLLSGAQLDMVNKNEEQSPKKKSL